MNNLNAESDCKLDKLKTLGVFPLFGAANTLGFLHVSETLGHIGDPPDHFGTIFDNFFSFGFRSFSTNFPEKSYVPTPPAENGRGGGRLCPPLPFLDWRRLLSSPPENGRGGGPPFRKSPELAAYSAADSPEKVRVQKQDRKVESRPTTHFTETCFLDVLDLLITANAFLISILCVFANEHLECRK